MWTYFLLANYCRTGTWPGVSGSSKARSTSLLLTFPQFSILATKSKFKNIKHFEGQTKHVYSFCFKVLPPM